MLTNFLAERTVQLLAITLDDISSATSLPMHHKDPFDRMVIAQAKHRDMAVISKDEVFKSYSVQVVW